MTTHDCVSRLRISFPNLMRTIRSCTRRLFSLSASLVANSVAHFKIDVKIIVTEKNILSTLDSETVRTKVDDQCASFRDRFNRQITRLTRANAFFSTRLSLARLNKHVD